MVPIIEIFIVSNSANFSYELKMIDKIQSLNCKSFWFIILRLLAILRW